MQTYIKRHSKSENCTLYSSKLLFKAFKSFRIKRKLWKNARCGQEEMKKYKDVEKRAANAIGNPKRNFEKKLAKEKSKNSKPFYAYLKDKTRSRTTVGPLKGKDKSTINSNSGMGSELNNFFAGVFERRSGASTGNRSDEMWHKVKSEPYNSDEDQGENQENETEFGGWSE
jgi:hypothetical protein